MTRRRFKVSICPPLRKGPDRRAVPGQLTHSWGPGKSRRHFKGYRCAGWAWSRRTWNGRKTATTIAWCSSTSYSRERSVSRSSRCLPMMHCQCFPRPRWRRCSPRSLRNIILGLNRVRPLEIMKKLKQPSFQQNYLSGWFLIRMYPSQWIIPIRIVLALRTLKIMQHKCTIISTISVETFQNL